MTHLLCLLLGLFAFSQASGAEIRLALNWKPEPQFGGFYAAEKGGHFKKEKLNVKILPGGSGTPTIQMVAAGQVEYAVVSADEVVLSHDRGAKDVVALFATYQTNPQAIMARDEKNYGGIKDILQDEKVTLLWQAGLPYALYLSRKYKPLKAKVAPYSGGIGPLQKDPSIVQQCFMTSEPLAAQKAGLKVKVFLVADEGYNPYTTVLVTRKSRFDKDPGEVRRMVKAVRAGWEDYLKNPVPVHKHMHSLNGAMDLETFAASEKAQRPLIETAWTQKEGLGRMEVQRWKLLVDQLFDLKLIRKKPQPASLFIEKL